MNSSLIWVLPLAVAVSTSACGPIGPGYGYGEYGSSTSLSGSWQGTESGSLGSSPVSQNVNLNLSEDSEGNLTGSWSGADGSSGSLQGTVNGSEISIQNFSISSPGCAGGMTGSGSWGNGSLSVNAFGNGTCGEVSIQISAEPYGYQPMENQTRKTAQ